MLLDITWKSYILDILLEEVWWKFEVLIKKLRLISCTLISWVAVDELKKVPAHSHFDSLHLLWKTEVRIQKFQTIKS